MSTKIVIPEGWEVDVDNTTSNEIVLKEKKKSVRWEDIVDITGCYINDSCMIRNYGNTKGLDSNRNTWPTVSEAEACLALSQLCQWRNRYNGEWKPDWEDIDETKYCIFFESKEPYVLTLLLYNRVLHFKTRQIAEQFLEDFRDLIETAKPLL